MKIKKFMASLLALLMCFSAGNYVFADSRVKLNVYYPEDNAHVISAWTESELQSDEVNEYKYIYLLPGQTITLYVYPEPGYEVDWYLSDTFSKDPAAADKIATGDIYTHTVNFNDNDKYLIASLRQSDKK